MEEYAYIRKNAESILARVAEASRTADGVRVVAVTKSATDAEVLSLLATGLISEVAENRTQNYLARLSLIGEAGYTPKSHLIGSLQTNKVRGVIGKPDLIQSLDRVSLAEEIERRAAALGITQNCLLEVNSGREEAKGGVLPEEAEDLLSRLRDYPHIAVCGLMTMGPVGADEREIRRCFSDTRRLYEDFRGKKMFSCDTPVLSMGMSESYIPAILEGANMVRVGRAFFQK